MKKRIVAGLVLAVLLLCALSAASAAQSGRIEDFTAEAADSGIVVTLPAGYAEKGFFKLFWKDGVSGEIHSAVFPAGTETWLIEAEAGADYSFELFYARKRGLLPSSWEEDGPEEPRGPAVWKVLWADAETVDFMGFTNRMSEEDHRISGKTAEEFEACVEELTGGLVDIQITRMTIGEPVTSLTYDPKGYFIKQSDINISHYAVRKYDSVFVWGRMDGIYRIYAGITSRSDNPRTDPGYSFICLGADFQDYSDRIRYVCVHEWLHQLAFFYDRFGLEIPDPDQPEVYGHAPAPGGTLDPQFFREALTMGMHNPEGKFIGVPAEAWTCKPTDSNGKWNLSSLQNRTDPSWQPPEREPLKVEDPELLGTLDGTGYRNPFMGLGFAPDDGSWRIYPPEELAAMARNAKAAGEESDSRSDDGWIFTMNAESLEKPMFITLSVNPSEGARMKEIGEEAYIREQYQQKTDNPLPGWEDYRCEIIQRRIGDRNLSGLKVQFTALGIRGYTELFYRLNGEHADCIAINTYMSDRCDSILEDFFLTDP